MNRLWDTPEFRARDKADQALRAMPGSTPGALADALQRHAARRDEGLDLAAVVADLRRREAAGVRFWPGPWLAASEAEEETMSWGSAARTTIGDEDAELIDGEISW